VGVDLPGQRYLLGVAGATGRHHRDVLEGVRAATTFATTDLDLTHRSRLPMSPRRSAGAAPGGPDERHRDTSRDRAPAGPLPQPRSPAAGRRPGVDQAALGLVGGPAPTTQ